MVEKETTVGAQEGLHARPAAQFVKTAKGFSSEIVIVKDDKEANAKSSMKIIQVGPQLLRFRQVRLPPLDRPLRQSAD